MTARRRWLITLALLALAWLCRVHVGVPLAGQLPAVAFLGCAEVAALALIGAGIVRSVRAVSVRTT